MSLVPGVQLSHTRRLPDVARSYRQCMDLVARLASCGLIHCDLNEFNIMVSPDGSALTMIDFPQMVSLSHYNARELFERDVTCLRVFFHRRFGYTEGAFPTWESVSGRETRLMALDITVEASGYITAGEMAELGASGEEAHRRIGALARSLGVDVVAVGVPAYGGTLVADQEEALDLVLALPADSVVLVKASRSVGLDRLADQLRSGGVSAR